MAAILRTITVEDYIEDFIETVNNNDTALNNAIADLEQIINDGNILTTTITNNPNGQVTDISYNGKGRLVNDGNIESSLKVKGKTLEVTNESTFTGESTFNGDIVVNSNVTYQGGEVTMDDYINIKKDMSLPTRIISSFADTGVVGVVTNNTYNISVEGDYYIIINEAGSDLIQSATYNFIGAKPNQVLKVVLNTLSSPFIRIKLTDTSVLLIQNPKESFTLIFNELNEVLGTGEWVITEYSIGFQEVSRIENL